MCNRSDTFWTPSERNWGAVVVKARENGLGVDDCRELNDHEIVNIDIETPSGTCPSTIRSDDALRSLNLISTLAIRLYKIPYPRSYNLYPNHPKSKGLFLKYSSSTAPV